MQHEELHRAGQAGGMEFAVSAIPLGILVELGISVRVFLLQMSYDYDKRRSRNKSIIQSELKVFIFVRNHQES